MKNSFLHKPSQIDSQIIGWTFTVNMYKVYDIKGGKSKIRNIITCMDWASEAGLGERLVSGEGRLTSLSMLG